MTNCQLPSCNKELIHIEGRRPKKYCGISCRNTHYKILYPAKSNKVKMITIPLEQWESMNALILSFGDNKINSNIKSSKVEQVKQLPQPTIEKEKIISGSPYEPTSIKMQMDELISELIPKDRDTPLGRKIWKTEQAKRIQELETKLK